MNKETNKYPVPLQLRKEATLKRADVQSSGFSLYWFAGKKMVRLSLKKISPPFAVLNSRAKSSLSNKVSLDLRGQKCTVIEKYVEEFIVAVMGCNFSHDSSQSCQLF